MSKFCKKCGQMMNDDAKKCPNCGYSDGKRTVVMIGVAVVILVLGVLLGVYVVPNLIADRSNTGNVNRDDQTGTSTAQDSIKATPDNAQAEIEAFKNFRSKDLSAFLLHGKVKKLSEYNNGNLLVTYFFSEDGVLTKVSDPNAKKHKCTIRHKGNDLIIDFEDPGDELAGWAYLYRIDNDGKLIRSQYSNMDYSEESKYSKYDANGWPTCETSVDEFGGKSSSSISYSALDEYGNWTKCSDKTTRKIEYYPIK